MKNIILTILIAALILFLLVACGGVSSESETPTNEYITNLNYRNPGKMGDDDGPAMVIYSNVGYNRAEMTVRVSGIDMNTVRLVEHGRRPQYQALSAFLFLGVDVWSGEWWQNCFDAGLAWMGVDGGWRLFYNIFQPDVQDARSWWHSDIILPSDQDYLLVVDTSQEDAKARLSVYDMDGNELDSIVFFVRGMLADGSNTSYYMNFAVDYPGTLKFDRDYTMFEGRHDADWAEITLANTDHNLFMRNVVVEGAYIYNDSNGRMRWSAAQTSHLSVWPDLDYPQIDYEVIRVMVYEPYYHFRIEIDMNRNPNGSMMYERD